MTDEMRLALGCGPENRDAISYQLQPLMWPLLDSSGELYDITYEVSKNARWDPDWILAHLICDPTKEILPYVSVEQVQRIDEIVAPHIPRLLEYLIAVAKFEENLPHN